jgi:dTDP-4-dehydrorhamnose 3,5-epimerase
MPLVSEDKRGFFMKTNRARLFSETGPPENIVQDNHPGSRQGSLRGLHYRICHVQGLLLRVVSEEIFGVAVDLRGGSHSIEKRVRA